MLLSLNIETFAARTCGEKCGDCSTIPRQLSATPRIVVKQYKPVS
jgi:hypothetical protein